MESRDGDNQPPSEAEYLRQELHSIFLSAFRTDLDADTFREACRALDANGVEYDERTFKRRWEGDFPRKDREDSLRILTALTNALSDESQERIIAAWREYVTSVRRTENGVPAGELNNSGEGRAIEHWYQVIPKQETRDYVSIDLVQLIRSDGDLKGIMARVYPPRETKLRWNCHGSRLGEATHLVFLPVNLENRSSVGTVNLTLNDKEYRSVFHEGKYLRRDPSSPDGMLVRRIEWHHHDNLPTRYLPRVALLDLDNTLRSGWSIVDWVESGTLTQCSGFGVLGKTVLSLRDGYLNGTITHDTFAKESAEAYAKFAGANAQDRISRAATGYVSVGYQDSVFDFTEVLVRKLRNRNIAPILVTGAPVELVRELAQLLKIEEFFALETAGGVVLRNPGLRATKKKVVEQLNESLRFAVFGAGDSDSDIPLVESAPTRFMAPSLAKKLKDEGVRESTYVFHSLTTAEDVEEWLEVHLPERQFLLASPAELGFPVQPD